MTKLSVPPDILPGETDVEFALAECRTCHEQSGWVRIERDEKDRMLAHPGEWHVEHVREHGKQHQRYYLYTLTRNTGRTLFM